MDIDLKNLKLIAWNFHRMVFQPKQSWPTFASHHVKLLDFFSWVVILSVIALFVSIFGIRRDYTSLEGLTFSLGFLIGWNGSFLLRVYMMHMILTKTRFDISYDKVAFIVMGAVLIKFVHSLCSLMPITFQISQILQFGFQLLAFVSIVVNLQKVGGIKWSHAIALVFLVLLFEKMLAYMFTGMGL